METKLKADIEDIRSGINTGRLALTRRPTRRAGKTHAGERWRLTATRQFYLSFVICDSMAAR